MGKVTASEYFVLIYFDRVSYNTEAVCDLDDQGKYNQGTESSLLFRETNVALHFIPFHILYLVF